MRAKIEGVETKLGANGGKPYYVVNTMGSKITSFDAKFLACLGKEIEVEFGTNDKGYKTIKFVNEVVQTEHVATPPMPVDSRAGNSAVEAPLKATESLETLKWDYRAKSLQLALESAKIAQVTPDNATSTKMIQVADKYFKYITNDTHSE